MSTSRVIALGFGATHVLMCVAAAATPAGYGRLWLGETAETSAARAALRGLAICDALPAVLVVDAVLRRRPLRARLAVGVVSDIGRAAAALAGRRDAPQPGNAAMVAASLTGASIATSLLPHVDA
ncbi:MAG: hypothetical protein AVDCRST_MAG65-1191 [uncultured Solirubrobacteraceae bacterium]|uniref:DUF4267 domain-containing protein n=1 Tax=uncultured Solirubrobacteraceae bacterium TaxID=1162706 RepID=A0A6J4RMG3_9ACTN|nr:MAG: hypothetical protein AVDCRST_MAG65-1191 [uncultured Solirubrobacteraceae bacterium]